MSKSMVTIEVITIQPQQEPTAKIINHDDSSDRKWLAKHCWWAMRNGVTIITRPLGGNELSA